MFLYAISFLCTKPTIYILIYTRTRARDVEKFAISESASAPLRYLRRECFHLDYFRLCGRLIVAPTIGHNHARKGAVSAPVDFRREQAPALQRGINYNHARRAVPWCAVCFAGDQRSPLRLGMGYNHARPALSSSSKPRQILRYARVGHLAVSAWRREGSRRARGCYRSQSYP